MKAEREDVLCAGDFEMEYVTYVPVEEAEKLEAEIKRLQDTWLEFVVSDLCGLCGCTGYITQAAVSAAGVVVRLHARPCICPNGRAIKTAASGEHQ